MYPTRSTPIAGSTSCGRSPGVGRPGRGSPAGTAPMTAMPWSSRPKAATAAVPSTRASRLGYGKNRATAKRKAIAAAEKITVAGWACPRFLTKESS